MLLLASKLLRVSGPGMDTTVLFTLELSSWRGSVPSLCVLLVDVSTPSAQHPLDGLTGVETSSAKEHIQAVPSGQTGPVEHSLCKVLVANDRARVMLQKLCLQALQGDAVLGDRHALCASEVVVVVLCSFKLFILDFTKSFI